MGWYIQTVSGNGKDKETRCRTGALGHGATLYNQSRLADGKGTLFFL